MPYSSLPAINVRRKRGKERFKEHRRDIKSSLLDFWQWSSSDLTNNALRGTLAEFIVAMVIGKADGVRMEWDSYDLEYRSKCIEVKSAAYLQTWDQDRHSAIGFDIHPSCLVCTGRYARRRAHLYIFCLLAHKNKKTINPLHLDQWEFYVLSKKKLNKAVGAQKRISLGRLLELHPRKASFSQLRKAINATIREML